MSSTQELRIREPYGDRPLQQSIRRWDRSLAIMGEW